MALFAELKRRNVFRVGIAYSVIGWVLAQVAEFAFENFGAPDWVLKTVVVIIALGLPIALFFAWAFELTPEGVKREKDVDRSQSTTPATGRKLDFLIIAALVVALGYFIWERQSGPQAPSAETAETSPASNPATDDEEGPIDRSIAVLPFVNMSSDEEQQWFADGLTEEVLNSLARTPDILVASRTSSFGFKDSTEDIRNIATALGVAHILEGSVRRGSDRIRVTAQLIRAEDGFHLWSQTYDRTPDDVIQIQEDLAIQIAKAMKTAMDPDALARMMSAGTASVAAYEAYLAGTAQLNSTTDAGDEVGFHESRQILERATELDPNFALAHRMLALYWSIQLQPTNIYSPTVGASDPSLIAGYREAITTAIRLEKDPIRATSYRADQATNELHFEEALRLNSEYLAQRPFDREAQVNQLTLFANLNRWDDAERAVHQYFEQDGYDPVVAESMILTFLYSGKNDALEDLTLKVLQRFPNNVTAMYQAHRALLWLGKIDDASRLIRQLEASRLEEDNRTLVLLRQACAEGRLADATRLVERAEQKFSDNRSIMWLSHMIIGRKDEAYEYVRPYDDANDMIAMWAFYGYGTFDPTRFPNLMHFLEERGIEPHGEQPMPYRCKFPDKS